MSKHTADSGMSWTAMVGSSYGFLRIRGKTSPMALFVILFLAPLVPRSFPRLTSVQMKPFDWPSLNRLPLSPSQCCRRPLVSNCCATVPGEPVTPQCLCDSSDRAKKQSFSFQFFDLRAGADPPTPLLLLSLLKHSPQTPHPPPPPQKNPCDSGASLNAPLPLFFSLLPSQHKAHPGVHVSIRLLPRLSRRRSRGWNPHQVMLPPFSFEHSSTVVGRTGAHFSSPLRERSSGERERSL